jgi:cytochrome oxidase Cu insertion factor (SCO1/SenC/PrrC family)
MLKRPWVLVAVLLFSWLACDGAWSQEQGGSQPGARRPRREAKHPPIGSVLPDFVLKDVNGKPVKLSDYRGKIFTMELGACT